MTLMFNTVKEAPVHFAQNRNKIFENTIENTFATINDRIEYVYSLSESNQRLRGAIEDSLIEFEFAQPEMTNPEYFWGKFEGLSLEALMSDVINNGSDRRLHP
jgi:hypothetical protein